MEEQKQATELQIIQAKQSADFAMTPVGQTVKQFEVMQRMANMYTTSTIVPDTYKGNIGNCVIALDMAMRMGCNALMCMQNLYIVHGNPAFSSKFLIAINASGRFSPLRYEFKGEEGTPGYGCRCVAYESSDKEHKEPLHGDWITMGMAEKEGWTRKNGSKWQSMPSQMLRYRAAAFWQRVYCPEISMGLITKEEADDIQDAEYIDMPVNDKLAELAEKATGVEEPKVTAPKEQPQANASKQPQQKNIIVMETQQEIWKDVVGYEDYYQVSNFGKVCSKDRTTLHKDEKKVSYNGIMLTACNDTHGYLFVTLSVNGKSRKVKVHRLVAIAFIPNLKNKPEIDHINANRHTRVL